MKEEQGRISLLKYTNSIEKECSVIAKMYFILHYFY